MIYTYTFLHLQAVGGPLNKAWTKSQIQGLFKRRLGMAKKTGDDRRAKQMKDYVDGTGGGPGRQHLESTPADDIDTAGVDPGLLTGRDPVFDSMSIVAVPAGTIFSSIQDQSGVGFSRVAPSRLAATTTSGACAYPQLASVAVQPIRGGYGYGYEETMESHEFLVNVAEGELDESMASSIISSESSPLLDRRGLQPVTFSTPVGERPRPFNNTFSSVSLTPVGPRRALNMAAQNIALPAASIVVSAPPAERVSVPPPALAAAGANGAAAAPSQTKRKRGARKPADPPSGADTVAEMMRAKFRLDRDLALESVRLDRIAKKAMVEASRQQALYWELMRENVVTELLAKGQSVSDKYKTNVTVDCPLLSGTLASEIDNVELGDREVILTVMSTFLDNFYKLVQCLIS